MSVQAIESATRTAGNRSRPWIAVLSAAVSFAIYAAAVLVIQPEQQNKICCEQSSLAAVVSNVYYGAPFGTVHVGVLDRFLDGKTPSDQALLEASRREIPPGPLLPTTADGNGIGLMVVANIGIRLFGPYPKSAVLMVLVLAGISAFAFLMRFKGRHAVVALLNFTALTALLFSPLAWNPAYVINIPLGGIRYFSLLTALPAFHLMLECIDTAASDDRWRPRAIAPAGI